MGVHHLSVLLQRAAGFQLLTALGRRACRGLALVITVALAAVFLDAILALPAGFRIGIDVSVSVVVVASIVALVRLVVFRNGNPRRTARQIERTLGYSDNRLINAFELSEQAPRASSPALVLHVVRRGESTASELSSSAAVDFRPLWRSLGIVLMLLVVAGGFRLAMPGLFAAVLPRYFDPRGDHPPYTLVTFDVRVSPDPILYGKPAEIAVTLGGPETIGQADAVFVDEGSSHRRESQRLPLFRTGEGEFTLPLARVERSQAFFIETPRGRSVLHRMTVEEIPSIESAIAVLRFPKYTGWKEVRQPLDVRGLRGLAGTEVEVSLTASLPLRSGRLELVPDGEDTPARTVELHPAKDDSRTVTGKFPLQFSGRFHAIVTSDKGADGRDPVEGKLTTVVDRPPQVGILHPEPQLVVVEGYTVPVVIQATDDVAVTKLRLEASVNGFGPSPVDLDVDHVDTPVVRGATEFALSTLGAKAGDVITYFATAWDGLPPNGQIAETASHVIRVISEDEYLEYARSEYQMNELIEEIERLQDQLDELRKQRDDVQQELESLQKRLKEKGDLSKEETRRLEDLRKKLAKYSEQLDKLAQQSRARSEQRPLYDLEESLTDLLQKLAKELEHQSGLAKEAADDLERLQKDPTNEELRKELEDALEELQKSSDGLDDAGDEEREQLHQEMNRLRKVDELIKQGERLQKVVDRQRDLADRLGEFREREKLSNEDQQRADRLAREQERLQQELEDATQKLEQAAKECEGECPATAGDAQKLAQAIREQKIGQDQQDAAGSARKGDGRKAHSAAESAAEKLETLAETLPDADGAAGEMADDDPGLKLSKPGRGKSLRQMAQARRLPGLHGLTRPKPGQQPGGKADADGQGNQGSVARSTIVGPHQPLGNRARPRPGRTGLDGEGQGPADTASQAAREAESLTPEGRAASRTAAGNLRGVPTPFRDQAEAYFRRLAGEK